MPANVERLTDVTLFAGLTPAECEELLQSCVELTFSPGDAVIRAGDFEPALYVVLEGVVEIMLDVPGGEESLVASVGDNGVFGESSFFHLAPHSATVRCQTPTRLLRLSRSEFERLLTNDSLAAYRVAANAAKLLAARLQATDHWLSVLLMEQQGAVIASWRRFREGLGGSFDFSHGFVHPY
jgi:CRP/FNR family cyclic AMP-dependent transcriptional regulator